MSVHCDDIYYHRLPYARACPVTYYCCACPATAFCYCHARHALHNVPAYYHAR